ncbi:nicotinate phosphoribosyltransferase isoform X2 [Heptranchias perlo]|uniref:nicotinate phosphoribosyltransferase isoform X2 n=1 Tax=Heptranchias perlo TaxID=212740 RepID=UPI00355A81D4
MLQGCTVQPLLTDLYQFTMAYGYWKSSKEKATAVFELYFRESPLGGEFTIFAGLQDCLLFLSKFQLTKEDVKYLQSVLPPTTEQGFYDYLRNIDTSAVTLRAVPEGSLVFPKVALLVVEGPLAIVQLLETPLLTLVNYASLVATNAARFRLAVGPEKRLLEMGLRRAQGPDGGLSASRYSYIGGFDGTSNVLAGKLYGIPLFGSMAHSYITSFTSMSEVEVQTLKPALEGQPAVDFVSLCKEWLARVCRLLQVPQDQINSSELAAFISYAMSYPRNFIALADTYNVMRSGVPNFCAVSLALHELGYRTVGLRLDSGDLVQQSLKVRRTLRTCAAEFGVSWFSDVPIIVSNGISEKDLIDLQNQLTQVCGKPRIKLSEDREKMTLPGKKTAYRLYGPDGSPFLDLLTRDGESPPRAGEEIQCNVLSKRGECLRVRAARVETLYRVYFKHGQVSQGPCTPLEIRTHAQNSLTNLHPQHKHLQEPVPYQVAVTTKLCDLLTELTKESSPLPWQPDSSNHTA